MGCGTTNNGREPSDPKDNLAGGHAMSFQFLSDGTLLKAGKDKEIEFFEEFNKPDSKYYQEMQVLKPFIPEYYGIVEKDGKKWIHMKNEIHGISNVSFMDIKMGDKSYSPGDPQAKVERQQGKDKLSTSPDHGFRMVGTTIKDNKGEISYKLLKKAGEIKVEDIPGLLEKFLKCNNEPTINIEAAIYFHSKIKEILKIIETKTTRLMIASTVLFWAFPFFCKIKVNAVQHKGVT